MTLKTLNRSYNPVTEELTEAIVGILKENEEADTKTVCTLLMLQHSDWKVPERRVRKFVKRHRSQLGFDGVDDDMSTFSSDSSLGVTEAFSSRAKNAIVGSTIQTKEAASFTGNGNPTLPRMIVSLEEHVEESLLSPIHDEGGAMKPTSRDSSPAERNVATVTPIVEGVEAIIPFDEKFGAIIPVEENGGDDEVLPPVTFATPLLSPPRKAVPASRHNGAKAAGIINLYQDDNDGKKQGGLCDGCVIL